MELEQEPAVNSKARIQGTLLATLVPGLFGFFGTYIGLQFSTDGYLTGTLFFGVPVVTAFLTGLLVSFQRQRSKSRAAYLAIIANILTGFGIVAAGLEGLVCLFFAAPLSIAFIILGSYAGYAIGHRVSYKRGIIFFVLMFASLPLLMGMEAKQRPELPLHEVKTSVLINATKQQVWNALIDFKEIKEEPDGIFKLGIAYPLRARIEGKHGVGAVRYCEFSTGPFVEPITTWDEPNLLAFDVKENPIPLKELSPYKELRTKHLHGIFVSKRGQLKLTEENGHVRLEGTTWYTQQMTPDWYWAWVTDGMIHKIHLLVLNHVKRQAEGN